LPNPGVGLTLSVQISNFGLPFEFMEQGKHW